MKVLWITLLIGVSLSASARAAENVYAAAQRQEAEEQYRRANARINALEEALQSYQHEMNALKAEMRGLREEIARANNRNNNAASQEAIRQLAESIQEVDRKRMADNEKVLKSLLSLSKPSTSAPATSTAAARRPNVTPAPATPVGDQYEYTVKSGDTLSEIVRGLRELGVEVTQTQVEKANPKVNWSKLRVGAKIIIPASVPK